MPRITHDIALAKQQGVDFIIGCDEVGYGAFAGPVYIGMCRIEVSKLPAILKGHPILSKVRDSKKLSPERRKEIYEYFKNTHIDGLELSLGAGTVDMINSKGINSGLDMAFTAAHLSLGDTSKDLFVMDGNKIPPFFKDKKAICIIKGDDISIAVGLSSIMAKVERDELMVQLAKEYPAFKWENNKGYGADPDHQRALQTLGMSPHHRHKYCRNYLPK